MPLCRAMHTENYSQSSFSNLHKQYLQSQPQPIYAMHIFHILNIRLNVKSFSLLASICKIFIWNGVVGVCSLWSLIWKFASKPFPFNMNTQHYYLLWMFVELYNSRNNDAGVFGVLHEFSTRKFIFVYSKVGGLCWLVFLIVI